MGIIYFIVDLPSVGQAIMVKLQPERFHALVAYLQADPNNEFQGLIGDPRFGLGIPFMLLGRCSGGCDPGVRRHASSRTAPSARGLTAFAGTIPGIPPRPDQGVERSARDCALLFVVVTGFYVIDRLFCR